MRAFIFSVMLQALSSAQGPTFPPLKAENLNGVTVDMPSGFEGDLNLLLIAFLQKQQPDVDTWLINQGTLSF